VQYLLSSPGVLLAADPPANQSGPGGYLMLPAMILIALMFWYLFLRPQRKEQQQRQAMVSNLKKNDRVVTVGGIYGVVTNVHREADEVTIKVDEATNTKLRVTLGAISRVVGDQPSPATPADPGTK
jgi:preprotein translocase subunit YajC